MRHARLPPIGLLIATAIVVAPSAGVLLVLPILALFTLLMLGRFPGEDRVIARIRAARVRPRAAKKLGAPNRRRNDVLTPRGSSVLAFHLGMLPPPNVVTR